MTRAVRVGAWRVWLTEPGDEGVAGAARAWIARVETAEVAGEALHRSKHATTYRLTVDAAEVYVKMYHRYHLATALKDLARPSKARHLLAVSEELRAARFCVPRVIAAAEDRRGPWVRRSWVVTAALNGVPLAAAVAGVSGRGDPAAMRHALRAKRALLAALGGEVARLHTAGFVAGDLVPSNVWTASDGRAPAFLDHDRTSRGRGAAPWWRARRNLVQLNRVVLDGVVLTDRLRVFRAYAAARAFPRRQARRRLGWIVAKTIERRRRFDHVALDDPARVSFRELMRPGGRFAPVGAVTDATRATRVPDASQRGSRGVSSS